MPTIGENGNLCRIFSLLFSDSVMESHNNTYEGLFESCGSTESSNTNCVLVACILTELSHKRCEVSQKNKMPERHRDKETSFLINKLFYSN